MSKLSSSFFTTSLRVNARLSLVLFLLMLLYGILNYFNGRFQMFDLWVYYEAAEKLMVGDSPYHQAFGLSSGFYKYSPFAAYVFVPFHLISWLGTRIVFFSLIAFTLALSLPVMSRYYAQLFGFSSSKSTLAVFVVAVMIGGHVSRELLLGNVNWLLLLLLLVAFELLRRKPFFAGLLIAIALAFKPHFAVLIPWLVLRGHWRALGASVLGFGGILLLPSLAWGWQVNRIHLAEWLSAMQMHNTRLADSPNTLYGLPSNMLQTESFFLVVIMLGIAALLILGFILRHMKREKNAHPSVKLQHQFLEYSLILALIPNLVHTDTEHFMWTLPLLFVLTHGCMSAPSRERLVVGGLVILCLIPYTFATPDLWGAEISNRLERGGFLGWSNLGLIFLALSQVRRKRMEKISVQNDLK